MAYYLWGQPVAPLHTGLPLLSAVAGELIFVPRFRIQSEDRLRIKEQDKATQRKRKGVRELTNLPVGAGGHGKLVHTKP